MTRAERKKMTQEKVKNIIKTAYEQVKGSDPKWVASIFSKFMRGGNKILNELWNRVQRKIADMSNPQEQTLYLKAVRDPDLFLEICKPDLNRIVDCLADKTCKTCGGTGQNDPLPGEYHGLCPDCNGKK